MKFNSLKFKLTLIMAGVVTAVIALICVCNTVFFEKYYINDRLNLLRSSYEDLKTVRLDKDYTVDKVIDEIVEIISLCDDHKKEKTFERIFMVEGYQVLLKRKEEIRRRIFGDD